MNEVIQHTPPQHSLSIVGAAANDAAKGRAFADYLGSKAQHTLTAQLVDLKSFAAFLQVIGVADAPSADQLQRAPSAWQGVTYGLVFAYREWLMGCGYAVATVNRRLATVKIYAALGDAHDPQIATVKGLGHKTGRNRDAKRIAAGTPTQVGFKKVYKAVSLNYDQARQLKTHPATPQGHRDAFLMCLLLDHGLRCGEVALLEVSHFDVAAGTMNFYRPKVDKAQTHKLTADTQLALRNWIASGAAPSSGSIWRGSRKGGVLTKAGMGERAINARVRAFGQRLGLANLSPHDCRHYWATRATKMGTHPRALQQAGGWNSPAMVMRYVDEAEIANEGVKL